MRLSYEPVVKSFINEALKVGLFLVGVDDDDEYLSTNSVDLATEWATASDIGRIYFSESEDASNPITTLVVLGNDACETIADYDHNEKVDIAWNAWNKEWDGVPVPTKR